MAVQDYKINYKSDFVLNINGDAGWAIPFCIKFWTGMPSQAYFVGFDGVKYVNCKVGDTPTQLLVMFDDHHLPIGKLEMQIAYHTTIEEFPGSVFDEVTNPTNVTVDIDGTEYQVMLDFTGETGAEIDFSMPSSGVMSVNGKIGYVTLNAEDVGAQPTIEDLATIRSGAAAGATAVQPAALTPIENDIDAIEGKIPSAASTSNQLADKAFVNSALSGKADAADIPTALSQLSQDSTHRVVTDAEKSTWNGKQNAISDLATIRSGAAAGATAVQPAAMNTALAAKQDTLTFDNTPTANSNNPVKSSGIKTALDAKQSTISTVNVTVDNNTGTPSGSASVSGSTLSLSFQNLKGATGATGATGPQGPQGERGLPGESGVTGDVSGFTVRQTIDPSATYGATDIAGAATVQATNAELTELDNVVHAAVPSNTISSGNSDLDIADEEGNILVRFEDGHIKTKNFDSSDANVGSQITSQDSDLDVVDENDNIIVQFANGHIKTKFFDSSDIQLSDNNTYMDFKEPLKSFPIDVTKPQHIGQINVQRKVDALCDIHWTPIRPMPSSNIGFISNGNEDTNVVSGRRYYTPNTEITGIPYSTTGLLGKAVGCDISIETFMTAVDNPNSVLYTKDLRDNVSGTFWSTFYGLNCSSFTNYIEGIYSVCVGRNNRFAANRILRSPKNCDALQIGDVIYLQRTTIDSGHTVIVYKIDRDANGFITQIYEAEEDSRKANKYSYTREQFENRFFKGGYGYVYGDIYRNVDLVDNLYYESFDESSYVYSSAVALNLGNNTNYNKADNIPIEVTLFSGVSGFSLLLDNTVIETYTAEDGLAGYGDTTIVTIDKSSLSEGFYEVRPSSGLSQYFCLCSPGTVSVSKDRKENVTVSASGHSSNVSTYGVLLISSRGAAASSTTRGLYLTNGEDSVTIPFQWIDFINTTNDISRLAVVFRNEYGNIYSEIINL